MVRMCPFFLKLGVKNSRLREGYTAAKAMDDLYAYEVYQHPVYGYR